MAQQLAAGAWLCLRIVPGGGVAYDGGKIGFQGVEMGPHRLLHLIGHEMGVDIKDSRHTEILQKGREVVVVTGKVVGLISPI